MLTDLKKKVLEANLLIVKYNLAIETWGNVSGFDPETKLLVIKASGIPYDDLSLEHMIVVDLEGDVVEGHFVPSTDTLTHCELYKQFAHLGIHGIAHTHSKNAVAWAQTGKNVPCYGTTHSDYFFGDIPVTRKMLLEEIDSNYEKNTGKVIVERFKELDWQEMSAVLVHSHGPFVWGNDPISAVKNNLVLEEVLKIAVLTRLIGGSDVSRVQKEISDKHYKRKFGKDAYYGQK